MNAKYIFALYSVPVHRQIVKKDFPLKNVSHSNWVCAEPTTIRTILFTSKKKFATNQTNLFQDINWLHNQTVTSHRHVCHFYANIKCFRRAQNCFCHCCHHSKTQLHVRCMTEIIIFYVIKWHTLELNNIFRCEWSDWEAWNGSDVF